ncbi:energy transducer TonB [Ferrovibrio sp.]|uniref:energy transducer TonB n=1 Tax=Ferrovibrio sp. TaxID=1917215 RepID=UPI003D2DD9CE
MALLAESLLPPAALARGRRVGAPSILGALLLHGGAALAMLLLARHSLPVPAVEIEVIWPAPQLAPSPTAPAAAEPVVETLPPPVPQAMPEPEPEPEPLPDPLAEEPPPPPREKPKPPPKSVVKSAPAPQPVQEMSAPAPTLTEAPPTTAVTPAAQAAAEPVLNAPPAASREIKPQEAAPPASPYNAILLDWLRRHMEYPRAARLRRQQGEVRLKLELDRGGKLLAASLATSSTHAILDEAALSMAQRAAPYPPPLDLLGQQRSVVFIVPLRFELTP